MINPNNPRQLSIEEFKLPFAGEPDKNNRWVKPAEAMPWEELSGVYNRALSKETGRLSLSARRRLMPIAGQLRLQNVW